MPKIQRLRGNFYEVLQQSGCWEEKDFLARRGNDENEPLFMIPGGLKQVIEAESSRKNSIGQIHRDLPRTDFIRTLKATHEDGSQSYWEETDFISAWFKDSAIKNFSQGYLDAGFFSHLLVCYRGMLPINFNERFRFGYFDEDGRVCALSLLYIEQDYEDNSTNPPTKKPKAWIAVVVKDANLELKDRKVELMASESLDLLKDPEILELKDGLKDFHAVIKSAPVTKMMAGLIQEDGQVDNKKIDSLLSWRQSSFLVNHEKTLFQSFALSLVIASSLLLFIEPVVVFTLCVLPILWAIKCTKETDSLMANFFKVSEPQVEKVVTAFKADEAAMEAKVEAATVAAKKVVDDVIASVLPKKTIEEDSFNLKDFYFEDEKVEEVAKEKAPNSSPLSANSIFTPVVEGTAKGKDSSLREEEDNGAGIGYLA